MTISEVNIRSRSKLIR